MKRLLLILIVIATIAAGQFYIYQEARSHKLAAAQNLPENYANSIKHADAAASVYRLFRVAAVQPNLAQTAVIRLGILNEWMEQMVLFGHGDDTREIMKDYHNNLVGIVTAQWLEKHRSDEPVTNVIVGLAKLNILMIDRNAIHLPAVQETKKAHMEHASQWLKLEQDGIRRKVEDQLGRLYPV